MQKIILIIGLPGSGKTTYISQHKELFSDFVICDDYHKSALHKSKDFKDSAYYSDVKNALCAGKSVVLTDIAWCKAERINIVIDGINELIRELGINPLIDFLYFENNPEICKKNAMHRGRAERIERELEFIEQMSRQYFIPNHAAIIPVVDASNIK